jgi:hypothetical protein
MSPSLIVRQCVTVEAIGSTHLKKLVVINCHKLNYLDDTKSVVDMEIEGCDDLVFTGFDTTNLFRLVLSDRKTQGVIMPSPKTRELTIDNCFDLVSIIGKGNGLKVLNVTRCLNLKYIEKCKGLVSADLYDCPLLETFPMETPKLKVFGAKDCPELSVRLVGGKKQKREIDVKVSECPKVQFYGEIGNYTKKPKPSRYIFSPEDMFHKNGHLRDEME